MKRLFLGILAICWVIGVKAQEVFSPDGKINVRFFLSEKVSPGNQRMYPEGTPYYEVFPDKHLFLLPSRMGFDLLGTAEMKHYFKVSDIEYAEHNSVWKPCYGEKQEYPDKYREMKVMLEETLYPYRKLYVIFRTYNEGIAFRYEIPYQSGFEKVVIDKELTEFAFPKNTSVWESHGHEGKYYKVYPFEVKTDCELPLTCQTPQGVYGAIMEAGNNHYPRAYLEAPYRKENILRISLRGEAKGERGMVTAWRVISLADEPGKLMEQNYLLYNLNESCKLADTSWIKPGTVMRETTISTPECLKMIDYCASMGISYMILDWGWYGLANSHKSDPSIVNVTNPATGQPIPGHPGLDLLKVINYGKEKGVGVLLWLTWLTVENHFDVFKTFSDWGVAGIKIDFMDRSDQWMVNYYERVAKEAAKYHLLIDFHGSFKPAGLEYRYPNILSYEGVRGMEQMGGCYPDNSLYLPFMRNAVGPMDYTPGAMISMQPEVYRADRPNAASIGTRAYQLALYVVFESGVQMLADNPTLYYRNPDCTDFITKVPVTWDETKILDAKIGEYVVLARRKGDKWFIGAICNGKEASRRFTLSFDFLDKARTYRMTSFEDGINADRQAMDYRKKEHQVNSSDKLNIKLVRNGGWAAVVE